MGILDHVQVLGNLDFYLVLFDRAPLNFKNECCAFKITTISKYMFSYVHVYEDFDKKFFEPYSLISLITGKTRVMFEKATALAFNGEVVFFILFHDSECWPIFLYCSLMNEVKKLGLNDNLHLVMSKDLENADFQPNAHIFIDELAIRCLEDSKKLNNFLEKIRPESYVWITIAKKGPDSYDHGSWRFEDWLTEKQKQGFYIPNLIYALRNTKEIVAAEKSWIWPYTGNIVEEETALPTELWPFVGVETPPNQTYGLQPKYFNQDQSKSLFEQLQECLSNFPLRSRIVIISTFQITTNVLACLVEKIRGHRPLMGMPGFMQG